MIDWRPKLAALGSYALMLRDFLRDVFHHGVSTKDTTRQIVLIGSDSISIVFLTSLFTGMVLALQTAYGLQRYGAKDYVGNIVSLALVRELGPVLTAIMLCGRVGAGITAEIASMVASEQVDAIRALGADPIRKLVSPRILAALLVLPLLACLSNIFGVIGGILVAVFELNISAHAYYHSVLYTILIRDLFDGLIKASCFGFLLVSIACFKGLTTKGGTEGVGRSTTESVVTASIAVLIVDYFLTKFLIFLS